MAAKTTTEPAVAAATSARPRHKPSAFGVVSVSLAGFFIAVTLLAWQLGKGNDPALGATGGAERPALVRRIILTRIVRDPAPSSSRAVVGSEPAIAGTAAPAGAAPAPAPAPAAAPAPAPVSTGSS
jgi:hypothetical protein